MSKYVKYVSSSHYGAPEMKGDRFGYLVEMLRTVLCTGFNEHTDIHTVEVLKDNKFRLSFNTEHNYSINQTLKISNSPLSELNGESLIDTVEDVFNIICESYIDISYLEGIKYDGLNITSIVAPFGFIEKYSDGYKSVFTTDEDEAYFCIDDNTPSHWLGAITSNRTPVICPIVYMTDKKVDIDTDGRFIVPYDTTNPTWYKENGFLNGTYKRNGIWTWLSYGLNTPSSTSNGNIASDREKPIEYDVIGNGRLFYFLPKLSYNTTISRHIFYFGKINNYRSSYFDDLPYILNTSPYSNSPYDSSRVGTAGFKLAPTNYTSISSFTSIKNDLGSISQAILKINNKSSSIILKPNNHNNSMYISGGQNDNSVKYPDYYTKKLHISKIRCNDLNGYIGDMSGLQFIYNGESNYLIDGQVRKYDSNNGSKRVFIINDNYCSSITGVSGTTSNFIYFLSLDYKDWFNYDNN